MTHGNGAALRNAISVAQVAAAAFGKDTSFTSLQLNGSDMELAGPGLIAPIVNPRRG
jgi:hypothetical protein